MSNRNIGIKDVAVAAGVSVTTVSHVLNKVSYARISPETRDKVRTTAEQLGYGPNRLAQALRTQKTGMLGLVTEYIATTPMPAVSFWVRKKPPKPAGTTS